MCHVTSEFCWDQLIIPTPLSVRQGTTSCREGAKNALTPYALMWPSGLYAAKDYQSFFLCRVLRQQKKSTRATMESQEAAFWFCQKPPVSITTLANCSTLYTAACVLLLEV